MTRALVQISRLARALRPRAILLDVKSDGVNDVVRDLRAAEELEEIPLLVFARDPAADVTDTETETLFGVADIDLVNFVEKQR